jgi:hypothetical protein
MRNHYSVSKNKLSNGVHCFNQIAHPIEFEKTTDVQKKKEMSSRGKTPILGDCDVPFPPFYSAPEITTTPWFLSLVAVKDEIFIGFVP